MLFSFKWVVNWCCRKDFSKLNTHNPRKVTRRQLNTWKKQGYVNEKSIKNFFEVPMSYIKQKAREKLDKRFGVDNWDKSTLKSEIIKTSKSYKHISPSRNQLISEYTNLIMTPNQDYREVHKQVTKQFKGQNKKNIRSAIRNYKASLKPTFTNETTIGYINDVVRAMGGMSKIMTNDSLLRRLLAILEDYGIDKDVFFAWYGYKYNEEKNRYEFTIENNKK
ncbi:MAG: hypothetical protein HUJ42_01400 [Malacoplasma sp.]|nr:hypothetical protein [Malacoplasma sp.]